MPYEIVKPPSKPCLIHTYLRPTILNEHAPQLLDAPRCLNLVTIKGDVELPNDFERFAAIWPGPVFEFRLEYGPNSQPTEDIKVINNCLRIVSGNALEPDATETPLRVLNWARKSYTQLLTRAVASWGNVVSSKELKSFKGSNESVTALALKAHVASWVRGLEGDADLCFEESDDDYGADPEGPVIRQRIDLQVNGLGHFEIESLNGSGPMESFYQRKIFCRRSPVGAPGRRSDGPFCGTHPLQVTQMRAPTRERLRYSRGSRPPRRSPSGWSSRTTLCYGRGPTWRTWPLTWVRKGTSSCPRLTAR